jgi:hypothetical protein
MAGMTGFFVALFIFGLSTPAFAGDADSSQGASFGLSEGEISWGPEEPLPGPLPVPSSPSPSERPLSPRSSGCDEFDPDCRYQLERIFSSIRLAEPTVEAGVRFGQSGAVGAVRFSMQAAAMNLPLGDLGLLVFDANYVSGAGGFRLRMTVLESEALFFCPLTEDEGGGIAAPLASINKSCRPEGVWALGGRIIEYQQDFEKSRWNVRWLEINALANFLRNAFSREYIKRHILMHAGLSLDSGGGNAIQTYTALRGNLGISGVFRTENERFELRAYAGFRPNLVEWEDWAAEVRFSAMVNFLLSPRVVASLGLTAEYSHWNRPERSIGNMASGIDPDSAFLGVLFGVRWR